MEERLEIEGAITVIKRFLTGKLLQSGLEGYVVGLSGGIDSAVATALAVEAVGPEKVLAVIMPYRTSSERSVLDAGRLVEQLGIDHRRIDISPMIDAYYEKIDDSKRVRAGNKMARERMAILFDIAHETNRLVLGTGNRTEIALGYTTWYGDSACSVNPNADLYKHEIRSAARKLGIPEDIITKPPSADLWKDQTDEGEIGVTYEQIDALLERMVDDGETSMAILEGEGFRATDISRVVSLINRNSFKRHLPEIAPLGRSPIPDHVQVRE